MIHQRNLEMPHVIRWSLLRLRLLLGDMQVVVNRLSDLRLLLQLLLLRLGKGLKSRY